MTSVQLAGIEEIRADGELLAIVVSRDLRPDRTTFVTSDSLPQQLGFVVYPGGGEVARHFHLPLHRELDGTSEVLLIREGRCELDLFDADRLLVATRELVTGDVVLLVAGGHGLRMLEDTTLLEVKQGPYTGVEEKELF